MMKLNTKKTVTLIVFLFIFGIILKSLNSCDNRYKEEKFVFSKSIDIVKNSDAIHSFSTEWVANGIDNRKENTFGRLQVINKEINYLNGTVFIWDNIVDWKRTKIQTLSSLQIMDYLKWTNQSSCRIAQHFGGVMVSSATGLVSLEGQKALCLDNSVRPIGAISGIPGRCIVYSFGINYEWSFDDAMELYGCEIFSFDPSMNVSTHNRTKYIHFYQMAIGSMDNEGWKNSPNIPTRTLSSIYDMLKPIHGYDAIIDYLKIDIETDEWQVLPQIIESGMMDKVRQLAVEIHIDFNKSIAVFRQQASILQSLENYGMVRFDSKPNINTLLYRIHQVSRESIFNGYEIAWYNNLLLREAL